MFIAASVLLGAGAGAILNFFHAIAALAQNEPCSGFGVCFRLPKK